MGYEVVAWTHHCSDWLEHDTDFFTERLTTQLRPGSVFLLHDTLYRITDPGRADRSATLGAVERLLSARPDYRFVTVPELLEQGRAHKTMWFKKPDVAWLTQVDPLGLGGLNVRLSVIIPCYNAAATLGEQLTALSEQVWDQPWEVIVADNGSSGQLR